MRIKILKLTWYRDEGKVASGAVSKLTANFRQYLYQKLVLLGAA